MGIKMLIASGAGKAALFAKAHAPEILYGVGTLSFFATVISACKGTYKFEEVLEEHNRTLENLKKAEEGVASGEITVAYNKADARGDRIGRYIRTAWGFVRAYKWALIFGGISLGCFFAPIRILRNWFGGASAALAAMTIKHRDLEEAVRNKYGDEALDELRGEVRGDIKVTTLEGEDRVPKETTSYGDRNECYSKIFDSSNPNFEKNPESNRAFLSQTERWVNMQLQMRKHLFLNDVYDALGFEKTQSGQIMGWKYYDSEEERIKARAANAISFGIFDVTSQAGQRFVDGLEPTVILNFNVDPEPIIGKVGLAKS